MPGSVLLLVCTSDKLQRVFEALDTLRRFDAALRIGCVSRPRERLGGLAKHSPSLIGLPFVAANIAAAAGQEAVVLCTIDAVWLGTEGGTDGVAQPGLPALSDLYREFIDNGGHVWLCGACTKPRGITEQQVAKGSTIVGAAKVVEEIIGGAKAVAFA